MWWHKYLERQFIERDGNNAYYNCWSLVCEVYQNELGVTLPDFRNLYNTTEDCQTIANIAEAESAAKWRPVAYGQEKPFDVIILNMQGIPMHVGIITQKDHMLHCLRDVNTSHEKLAGLRWSSRIRGIIRHGERF